MERGTLVANRVEAGFTAIASALALALTSCALLGIWWWLYEGGVLPLFWSVAVVAGGGGVTFALAAALASRTGRLMWPAAAWLLLPGPIATALVVVARATTNASELFFGRELAAAALVMVLPAICAVGAFAVASNKRIEQNVSR